MIWILCFISCLRTLKLNLQKFRQILEIGRMLIYEISWNWNSWYFFDLTNFLQIVIFGFGIIVHEKMRQFIIVIEKYTKNDGNQNINGFNKVHENDFT